MKHFSKSIALILSLCMLISCTFTDQVFADETQVITVYVDGNQLEFDVDPITENFRTLVPMRAIFEALGATVSWNDNLQMATALKGNNLISITIDNNIMYKNETKIKLDVPARMVNDRTLVPVRAVSESFDATVEWSEEKQQVLITTNEEPEPTTAPIVTPTTAPATVTPTATSRPSVEKTLSSDKLSTNDMQKLKDDEKMIRYIYEQDLLYSYASALRIYLYGMMNKGTDMLDKSIRANWDTLVARCIFDIQMDSKTPYEMDISLLGDLPDIDDVLNHYSKFIAESGLSNENFIKSIKIESIDNKTKAAVITFKDAESKEVIECKFIAIVINSSDELKLYTAEGNPLSANYWFFCEIREEERGNIGYFDKEESESKDYDVFLDMVKMVVKGDLDSAGVYEPKPIK